MVLARHCVGPSIYGVVKTYVILDGLQDHRTARDLSAQWAQAGFSNAVDMAGQCAWLTPGDGNEKKADHAGGSLDEASVARASGVARSYGLAIRDRVGGTFIADNDLHALRRQMAKEYRSRLAVGLMFGLPAVMLHYLGPVLAGGVVGPRSLAFAWLIEALLVTWGCFAAGWPILWQGVMSLARLRFSGDALTTLIVLGAWGPSAVGVGSLAFADRPWLIGGEGMMFYAAMFAVWLAVLGRWLAYEYGDPLGGRADLMISKWHKLVGGWILLSLIVMIATGGFRGVGAAMLLPAMAGLGAVNPWSPGWSAVLPVFGFVGVYVLGPGIIGPGSMGLRVDEMGIEIAAGFNLMMTIVFALGWRAWGAWGAPGVHETTGVDEAST